MSHKVLWERVELLVPEDTAKRAKCSYVSGQQRYELIFLNRTYIVDVKNREIFSTGCEQKKEKASFLEELSLLAYLINAKDLPLSNELVSAEKLPGGQFFFRGLHRLPTGKLEKTFGDCPENLYMVVEHFSGKRCEFGDASIEFWVLPRIPLTMIIWRGCEEFDARASILFDLTAAEHMPLDALLATVNLAVNVVVQGV